MSNEILMSSEAFDGAYNAEHCNANTFRRQLPNLAVK